MGPNLGPPEGAIGKSRQEGDGMRKISLPAQENPEGRVLRCNDGASFRVVADALASGEPSLGRKGRRRIDGRVGSCANEIWHVISPLLDDLRHRPAPPSADP